MKKLILYSDMIPPKSEAVDAKVLELLDGTDFTVGYIPSESDTKRRYFDRACKTYEELGITDVTYFDLGHEYDPAKVDDLLRCSAIHLSGGDLNLFLNAVQKRQFKNVLRDYVERGGVLIGISAGAMLMAQSIELGDYFPQGDLRLKDKRALNLVNFDFFPHFDGHQKTIKKLCDFTLRSRRVLYACDDSEGIAVVGDTVECLGNVVRFENGKVYEA